MRMLKSKLRNNKAHLWHVAVSGVIIQKTMQTFAHSAITTARAIYSSDPLLVIRVVSLFSRNSQKTAVTPHTAHQSFVLIYFSFPILLFLLLLLAVCSHSPPTSLCPSSPCSLSSLPPSSHPSQHKRLVLSTSAVSLPLSFDYLPTSTPTHEHELQGDRHRGGGD